MSAKLTRKDIYRLGYRCIIAVSGNCSAPKVDGCRIEKLGHNEGTYGWNWNAYQIAPGFVLVDGYRNFPHADNEGATGYREDRILRNVGEFEHVETSGDHDCWNIFDRNGEGFMIDISKPHEFSIVG